MKKHTPTAQFAHFKHDGVMFMFHCIYKIILKDSCVWCHCRGTAGIMGTNWWQTDIFIPARVKKKRSQNCHWRQFHLMHPAKYLHQAATMKGYE